MRWGLSLIKEKKSVRIAATLYRQASQEEKFMPCLVIPASLYCVADLTLCKDLKKVNIKELRGTEAATSVQPAIRAVSLPYT